jgi:hypothetical protein
LDNNLTIGEGDPAKFTVKFSGRPKPAVKWFGEEKEIDFSLTDIYELVETDASSTLIIKSAKLKDAGSYFAKLTSEAGSVNSNRCQFTVKSNNNENLNKK